MKVLVVLVAVIHASHAALVIKGPVSPVLEQEPVSLECLFTDSQHSSSQVHFEVFSQFSSRWVTVNSGRYRCFFFPMTVKSPNGSLILKIPYARRYMPLYRCVADNVTAPDNCSEPLALKVHYMDRPVLSGEGFSRFLGDPQRLRVRDGEDVVVNCSTTSSEEPRYYWQKEGGDWILPSSTLTIKKVSTVDEGEYSCVTEHPSVASLNKKNTFSITVLTEETPWFETSQNRLMLLTSAVAAVLLVLVLSMSVFLCRRAKQAKTTKGPIDDRSQKKPIYRSSVESIPSTSGDKQPLV